MSIEYPDKFNLIDKSVVVTGGSGLIGEAICKAFVNSGATVFNADIHYNKTSNHHFLEFNMADSVGLVKNVRNIWEEIKGIDVWVNAAFPRMEEWREHPDEISAAGWDNNVSAQMGGYCRTTLEVSELMKKNELKGSIVNISSIFALVGHDQKTYEGTDAFPAIPYSAIKGGINSFTRFVAAKYGKYGIRVNSLSAGGVTKEQNKENTFIKQFSEKTLLGRMANPSEIANPVVFLCSKSASYITGENLVVDGGWTTT